MTPAPAPAVTGHTRLATVIGDPVRHSLSPTIHNAAFAAAGVDAVYLATEVAAGDAPHAVHAMRRFGWLGMSVTMPHKADVLAAVDRASDAATSLGAANCVYWHDGKLVADSTDGEGWVRGLVDELGATVDAMRCVVVGAGGAARAVVRALGLHGSVDIAVVNRSRDRAEAAVAQAPGVARIGTLDDLATADLVVNGTPLGMAGPETADVMPFEIDRLGADAVVSDLIYHPAQTPLLRAAADRGLRHQNGLAMLVFQAAIAFEHWTGLDAPVDVMKQAAAPHVAPA